MPPSTECHEASGPRSSHHRDISKNGYDLEIEPIRSGSHLRDAKESSQLGSVATRSRREQAGAGSSDQRTDEGGRYITTHSLTVDWLVDGERLRSGFQNERRGRPDGTR